MKKHLGWLKNEESGQGMVEYGLIIVLIAVVLVVALTAISGGPSRVFGQITTALGGS